MVSHLSGLEAKRLISSVSLSQFVRKLYSKFKVWSPTKVFFSLCVCVYVLL